MIKNLTTKEYSKKLQNLINTIKTETAIFANDNKTQQRLRKERAEKDFLFFAETYFPHYIRAKFGVDHKRVHLATEKLGKIVGLAGFRGFGKTTNLGILKPIWRGLHGKTRFNVKVAKNKQLATERTIAIRCEFLYNKRLIHDFGEQLGISAGEEHDFVIKEGCRYLAIGYKEGIRGKIHNSYRPDYIDIDDLEDHNSFNERIARDKLSFVTEEAYGAFEKGQGILVWLGNRTHQKSALNLFAKKCEEEPNESRQYIEIKADDGNFNPTWHENYTREDLLKIYNAMGKFGYERHMRMNPIIEGLKFQSEWFKYYSHLPEKFDKIITYVDPSKGSKKTSDYKAIITLGFSGKLYYVLDIYLRKASIIDMIRKLYALDKQFDTEFYMEANFWQTVLWDYVQQVAAEMGYLLPVHPVINSISKELRIERLEPLFQWGWILFNEQRTEDQILFEDQVLGFPDYPNDDGPDGLAGAVNALKVHAQPQEYRSVGKRLAGRFSNVW